MTSVVVEVFIKATYLVKPQLEGKSRPRISPCKSPDPFYYLNMIVFSKLFAMWI